MNVAKAIVAAGWDDGISGGHMCAGEQDAFLHREDFGLKVLIFNPPSGYAHGEAIFGRVLKNSE